MDSLGSIKYKYSSFSVGLFSYFIFSLSVFFCVYKQKALFSARGICFSSPSQPDKTHWSSTGRVNAKIPCPLVRLPASPGAGVMPHQESCTTQPEDSVV